MRKYFPYNFIALKKGGHWNKLECSVYISLIDSTESGKTIFSKEDGNPLVY